MPYCFWQVRWRVGLPVPPWSSTAEAWHRAAQSFPPRRRGDTEKREVSNKLRTTNSYSVTPCLSGEQQSQCLGIPSLPRRFVQHNASRYACIQRFHLRRMGYCDQFIHLCHQVARQSRTLAADEHSRWVRKPRL